MVSVSLDPLKARVCVLLPAGWIDIWVTTELLDASSFHFPTNGSVAPEQTIALQQTATTNEQIRPRMEVLLGDASANAGAAVPRRKGYTQTAWRGFFIGDRGNCRV